MHSGWNFWLMTNFPVAANDNDDDGDDDEDDNNQGSAGAEVSQEDEEEEDNGENESEESASTKRNKAIKARMDFVVDAPSTYQPAWLLTYMLFGQWGVAKFQVDVCTLFCGQAENFDSNTGKSRSSQRADKDDENTKDRDTKPDRGLSALHAAEIDLKQQELDQRDTELSQKQTMLVLETANLKVVQENTRYSLLEKRLEMNRKVMDTLEAQGKTNFVDSAGVNRYEIAEMKYWETYNAMNEFA